MTKRAFRLSLSQNALERSSAARPYGRLCRLPFLIIAPTSTPPALPRGHQRLKSAAATPHLGGPAQTAANSSGPGTCSPPNDRLRRTAPPPMAATIAGIPGAPATSAEIPPCAATTGAHDWPANRANDPRRCVAPPDHTNCQRTSSGDCSEYDLAQVPMAAEKPCPPHVATVLDRQPTPHHGHCFQSQAVRVANAGSDWRKARPRSITVMAEGGGCLCVF